MEERKPHAVVVLGPGLGHVNGCLLLAKALTSAGFCVTMVCFERAYKAQASQGRFNFSHASVHLEILPDGLPPDATSSYADFFHVTPSMHHNLLHLLQSLSAQCRPATCLISDTVMAWTQHVADVVGIPRVDYWTSTATSYLTILALPQLLSKGYVGCHQGVVPKSWKTETPIILDCIPGLTSVPLEEVPKDFRHTLLEKDPLLKRYMEVSPLSKHAHCVLMHAVYDLEKEAFQALKDVAHIEALPIGPLVHLYDHDTSAKSTNTITMTWLDAHAPSSVIFVSFGSNFVHTNDEIVELAHGLETSGKAFLWVIRPDSIAHGCEIDVVLPHGFKERTATRGLIMPWVSQLDVLGHSSVGGFLSHCGWNSTLESIWMGVPMLTCPKRAEQPTNSRFISKEWGVGIELKTDKLGTFSRDEVKIGICDLLDGTMGLEARAKARELSKVLRKAPFEGGRSHSNLVEFTSRMKERCLQHEEVCSK